MTLKDWGTTCGLFLCLLVAAAGWGRLGLRLITVTTRDTSLERWPGSSAERWYLSVSLGIGLLSWVTLFAGLMRWFYPAVAWGLLVIGAGAGLVWGRFPGRVSPENDGATKNDRLQLGLTWLLGLLGMSSLAYTLLANALMPPYEWDEVAYHLALAKLYIVSHGMVYVPFIMPSNWPMNTEMLFALGLLLRSELISHLVTWWMTLWAAWGLYWIGKRFLDRRIGWLAATLYLTVPLINRLSGSGFVDLSLPFYGTAALLAYAYYRQNRSLAWAGTSGLLCGLAAGSKLTGGGYPIIFGGLFLVDALRSPRLGWRPLLTRLVTFGGFGLLMVGPWYARSYALTGNPVWPFLYQVFGGRDWDWLGNVYNMQFLQKMWSTEMPLSLQGLGLSLQYLFYEPFRLGGYAAGLGQVQLGLTALSVLTLRRAPRLIYELLLMLILYYAMWFLFVSHQVRYLFFVLPALTLLGGFAFYTLWDSFKWLALRWILAGTLVLLLGRDWPWLQSNQRSLVISRLPCLTDPVAREAFLSREIDALPAFRYINSFLPQDATVLLLPYETRGYYLDRQYIWGHPMSQRVIRFEEYDTPEELARDLQALGVTHILDNPNLLHTELPYWERDRALMLALESRCGRQMAVWGNIILYRLERCTT